MKKGVKNEEIFREICVKFFSYFKKSRCHGIYERVVLQIDWGNRPSLWKRIMKEEEDSGLLISEATMVNPEASGYSGYPQTPGIYSDTQISRWRQITDHVHKNGSKFLCNFGMRYDVSSGLQERKTTDISFECSSK